MWSQSSKVSRHILQGNWRSNQDWRARLESLPASVTLDPVCTWAETLGC